MIDDDDDDDAAFVRTDTHGDTRRETAGKHTCFAEQVQRAVSLLRTSSVSIWDIVS